MGGNRSGKQGDDKEIVLNELSKISLITYSYNS